MSKPKLYYFQLAGRAELARLTAAAGGLEIDDCYDVPENKLEYGSPGSVPLLQHEDLKIAQSTAIEAYIAATCPLYKELTPGQRAVDNWAACVKEDFLAGCAAIFFNPEMSAQAAELAPPVYEKWSSLLEAKLPDDGFIHGLDFPSMADMVVVNICSAGVPFQALLQKAKYDHKAKFPKLYAHSDRVRKVASVEAYINQSKTLATLPSS